MRRFFSHLSNGTLGLGLLAVTLVVSLGGVLVTRAVDLAQQPHVPQRVYAHLLFVGDSITAGYDASSASAAYPAQVATLLQSDNFVNAASSKIIGLPGAQTADGLRAVRALPTLPSANLVVVEFGTNDFGRTPDQTLAAFRQSYAALLGMLALREPGSTFACLSLWGDPAQRNSLGHTPGDYNAIIQQACAHIAGHTGVYVDITPLFNDASNRGPAGAQTSLGAADDFHPNDSGHLAIARALVIALP